MVLLKEISEGIWGLIVASNQTSEVVTENPFRITMAALDIDVKAKDIPTGITRVTLKSSTADKGPATDLVLCNLQYPSCLQQPLDIEIYDGQTLTFAVQGPHKVHLTGYNLQPEPEEMHEDCHGHSHGENVGDYFAEAGESSDDDDSDDDDDDDDDDNDEDDDDSDEDGFPSGGRKRLRDDEDQDLEDDYEDGYVEGEDQLSSESDKKPKNKKQAKEESNGHATKKTKTNEDKSTTKKNKKEPTATATTSNEPSTSAQPSAQPKKTNSLEMKDLRVGNGPEAKLGKSVAVYYTGRLQSNNKTFDSCLKGKPFRFRLGAGEVIRGWDQGVKGMRVGGKRQLTIPPSLAYGNQKLPDIPANSTLVFDVELKNVF